MKKQCSSLWALAMLVLSLAVGAQNAPAGQGKTPEGIEAGGYSIQQSVELGYRYTDVAGTGANQEMFNTFLNLQTGPRVLEQTLSMRSLNHSGVLFDDLYVNSFGWGGDPNNAARVRVGKFKWYNFTGSFRRDQNYFDYPLLGNPMNNPLTSGIVAMPVNYSPHNFAVTRRMADVNLTLLPQSKVSVRLGYSRNRANGPSYNTNHEAGDAIMFQPWNTTFQTYNFGADFKLLPRTNISFDQFLDQDGHVRLFLGKAGLAPTQRGAGWIAPSRRGPRAPVTAGRLPGRPSRRCRASQANAVASRKSGSTPNAAVLGTGRGASSSASRRISAPLCTPPPQASTFSASGAWRVIAAATLRALSSSRVACTSAGASAATRGCAASQSRWKCSRPVLLGGASAK